MVSRAIAAPDAQHGAATGGPPDGGSWREVAQSWRIIVAAALAMIFYSAPSYSLPVLLGPLSDYFGRPRAEIASFSFFWSIGCVCAAPFAGWLADRFGPRRMLLVGMPLYGLAILAPSLFADRLWILLGCAVAIGVGATTVSTMVCGRLVSIFFDRGLGTALGLMTCGIGFSAIFAPSIMQRVVDAYGWRAGYATIAAGVFLSLPLVMWLTRRRAVDSARDAGIAAAPPAEGYDLAQVLRMPIFWLLGLAAFSYGACTSGVQANLVVYLTDKGFTRELAAMMVGAYGLFTIAGRVSTGQLLDRLPFHVARLMAAVMATLAVAYLLIGLSPTIVGIGVGLAIFGFLVGAEADSLAYCTVRVFGRRSFGAIYGVLGIGIFHVGVGIGPMAFSKATEMLGSHTPAFVAWSGFAIVAGLLFLMVARAPYFARQASAAA